jgi:glycosyltransferase involved in cell wall biosynthesis
MKFVFINTGTKQLNAGIIRCLGLGKGLAQRGHEVIILISNDQENIDLYGNYFEGIHFIYTTNRARGFEQAHKIFQLALLKELDVVHCMGAGSSIFMPALVAKLFFRKKFQLIVDYEDKQVLMVAPRKRKMHLFYESLSFRYANKIVCASQALAEEYKSKNFNTYYLPFAVPAHRAEINKPLITSRCLNIGYLGSINEAYQDQVEYLVSIFPVLKAHFGVVLVHIAGTGALHNYFKRKIKDLGFENQIIFYGFISDSELSEFFSKINLMFFYFPDTPLNRYRCPNKVFLCCSYGLSMVANQIGEVGKVLENYPKAAFFDGADHSSCITAIESMRGAKQDVPQTFYHENSWDAIVNKYLEIIIE